MIPIMTTTTVVHGTGKDDKREHDLGYDVTSLWTCIAS